MNPEISSEEHKYWESLVHKATHCEVCSKKLPIEQGRTMIEAGVPVYCSQYCFEVQNGTPMPGDSSLLIFDKIFNQ